MLIGEQKLLNKSLKFIHIKPIQKRNLESEASKFMFLALSKFEVSELELGNNKGL